MSRIAACALILVAAISASCSSATAGKPSHATSTSAAVASSSARSSATGSPATATPSPATATPSPTAAARTYAPGDVVLDEATLTADCWQATRGASSAPPTDTSVPGAQLGMSINIKQVTPHGIALVYCNTYSPTDHSTTITLIAVDARRNDVLWSRPIRRPSADDAPGMGTTEDLLIGSGQNVYLTAVTFYPASGLKAAYQTITLSALNASTGAKVWTKPYAADIQSSATNATVIEGPGPVAGQRLAIVNIGGYSAFDAATGKLLWRVPSLNLTKYGQGVYGGFGVALVVGSADGRTTLSGIDIATNKSRWTISADPTTSAVNTGNTGSALAGRNYWFIDQRGYDAYDVLTGKLTAHSRFPASFTNTLATPQLTFAQVGSTLRCYRTGDWANPVWSVAADVARPIAVTDQAVVVQGSGGTVLLSTKDGSTISNNFVPDLSQYPVADGLTVTGESIVAVGSGT